MFIQRLLLAGLVAVITSSPLAAADSPWTDNFEQAKKTAAAENKDLLLDFTGSDWCGWCMKLKSEVFETQAFKEAALKSFVLVEIDFPQKKKLSPEIEQQNKTLNEQFGIKGYPSIVLTDASGKPYAQTGYREGGPQEYLKHLEELRANKLKRDECWKRAESAQGIEKAKLLADGLKAMDEKTAINHYASVIQEIKVLDPEDQTGTQAIFAFKSDLGELQKSFQNKDSSELRPALEKFFAEHPQATHEQKQQALMSALRYCRPPKDNLLVKDLMTEVQNIDANSELGKKAVLIQKRVDEMIAREASQAGSKKD